jgi:hypothetical protein
MTHGRLGESKRCGEVTHTRFALRSRLDQTEQSKPSRIGECLEHSREALGIGTLNRFAGKRRDSW